MELAEDECGGSDTTSIASLLAQRGTSMHISQESSWSTTAHTPSSSQQRPSIMMSLKDLEDVDLKADGWCSLNTDSDEPWNTVDNITTLGLSFGIDTAAIDSSRFSLDDIDEPPRSHNTNMQGIAPFERWVKYIHKKAMLRQPTINSPREEQDMAKISTMDEDRTSLVTQHKKSLSESSLGFVTAVKTASVSLASFSLAPRSRRTGISSKHHFTDYSSKASYTGARLSVDSHYHARGTMTDPDVLDRSLKRRRVIEEIIVTEESYLGDMKFLMSVYNTLLASLPTISMNLRSSINRNLAEIVELHEAILGDLHRVVPHSEYTQEDIYDHEVGRANQSVDGAPWRPDETVLMHPVLAMASEPSIAADVAKIFEDKMHHFFAYQEYGSKYELMVEDIALTYRTLPQWETYQKGLEALGASLASINSTNSNVKKSLTVGDLLVKPIQRICRYPLLFADLLKQTHVCDCPESHMEIEKVLERLRETTAEINRAAEDPCMQSLMKKTWRVQDRLRYSDKEAEYSKHKIRALGLVHLCGLLYATWQGTDGIDGKYMITLLYKDYLVLATSVRTEQVYNIQAIVGLHHMNVENVDSGRGLQCHTAPFSWKIVFDHDYHRFEMILCACSAVEKEAWISQLMNRDNRDHLDCRIHHSLSSLSLAIKPLCQIFGRPGGIARRLSIHRATTMGAKSLLVQVVIKNTTTLKDLASSTSASINRSQSLLTTIRTPILIASRGERARLVNLLSDVWTKDRLPFPGMPGKLRGEQLVRASASSVMRKLSAASITSGFTKRSGSLASLTSFHWSANNDATTSPYGGIGQSDVEKEVQEDSDFMAADYKSPKTLYAQIMETNVSLVEAGLSLPDVIDKSSLARSVDRLLPSCEQESMKLADVSPQLRTKSALKILKQNRSPSNVRTRLSPSNGKENKPHVGNDRGSKGTVLNMRFSTEGLRSFFR